MIAVFLMSLISGGYIGLVIAALCVAAKRK